MHRLEVLEAGEMLVAAGAPVTQREIVARLVVRERVFYRPFAGSSATPASRQLESESVAGPLLCFRRRHL